MTPRERRSEIEWGILTKPVDWLVDVLRAPLTRNGYALVLSAGSTSVLGLLFWIVAARLFTVEEVGLNSALISTMITLGGIAQLNLGNVVVRYLPTLSTAPRRGLLLVAFGVGTVAPIVFSGIFVIGVKVWVPELHFLAEDFWVGLWFIGAVVAWCIFSLQEGVLTGLREATWIPVKNVLFGLAKLALLFVFATTALKAWGLFASWTVPLWVGVVLVQVLILRRLARASPQISQAATAIDWRSISRYFGGDTLGELLFLVGVGLAPILVLQHVGAEATAVYYFAWTVTFTLYFIGDAMAVSLVAEGAAVRQHLGSFARRALWHTVALLVVIVATTVVAAPFLLELLGPEYATDGVTLLRVLALSGIPSGVMSVFLGVARVQRRVGTVALANGALMVLVLGLGVFLLPRLGVLGMGIAWLTAQTAVALALTVVSFRHIGVSGRHIL